MFPFFQKMRQIWNEVIGYYQKIAVITHEILIRIC